MTEVFVEHPQALPGSAKNGTWKLGKKPVPCVMAYSCAGRGGAVCPSVPGQAAANLEGHVPTAIE